MIQSKAYKRWLPDALAVVFFIVISMAYFFPVTFEGKILFRHDSAAGKPLERERAEHRVKTGEETRWMNSLFGGMPTYQTAPSYRSTKPLSQVVDAYHLWLPSYVWFVFVYLLGFYIMLRAFDFRQHLAALGSVIWAFSSYFFIIIAAGHEWKVMALAYLPPLIGGIALAYRGKLLWGFLLTAVFSAFEVIANHVQMTYYFLIVILAMVVAYLVEAVRQRQMMRWVKASAVCVAAAAVGVCLNISNLYHTWQYGQETMRGKSELVKADAANQTSSGLERDYITQWSYGIDETWTLLVPNTKGGASVALAESETAMAHANPMYNSVYSQIGQYWGEQPGTSGPVYVGAFVLMLFVLGLFIVKGPMKWALLVATVLSVLLSWGKNFMPFTDFFLDYVPLYSKFRTVASILVVAEFTIPLLAIMALKRVIDEPDILRSKQRWLYVSFALTGGVALLFALMPTAFFSSFISASELAALKTLPSEHYAPIIANLQEMRHAVFTADCWRSFLIIAIGMACLLLYRAKRLKASYLIVALTVLCLVDMWQVNKRYLNNDMFVNKSVREQPVTMTQADEIILRDTTAFRSYRVLNLASNTFNENETSYYHNSIGGYHPAKLRRYQEMIDAYISPEMRGVIPAIAAAGGDMTQVKGDSLTPVLNMLNTRYFILPLQSGRTVPIMNPYSLGNAWFVDRITYADNANAELDAIAHLNLRHEAVADARFRSVLGEAAEQDGQSVVTLTNYSSNHQTYRAQSNKGGVIIFSDVYYPGWSATVDGQPTEVARVNYILRAISIAPGDHTVELTFKPKSLAATEAIAYTSYAVLLLALAVVVYLELKRRKRKA